MQDNLNTISTWTTDNMMRLNPVKSNYMIISRSTEDFATRLSVNNDIIDRVGASKILGVWIEDNLSWSRNCKEICVKAYSRLSLLTKLKYVGVKTEDLIDIYVLYIRSVTEYCSVAFHSSLTNEQTNKLERIQRTCLKVILGVMYIDYDSALEMTGLQTLFKRREKRCLDFSIKCVKHTRNSRLFPFNTEQTQNVRNREMFQVNFAKTSAYKKSTIPYCQRLLNKHVTK